MIIDRTNFDAAQRVSFLKLAAQQGVLVHCVVLHLDVSVCVKRATDRSNHEGGLQVSAGSIYCSADPDCGCEAHFSRQWGSAVLLLIQGFPFSHALLLTHRYAAVHCRARWL